MLWAIFACMRVSFLHVRLSLRGRGTACTVFLMPFIFVGCNFVFTKIVQTLVNTISGLSGIHSNRNDCTNICWSTTLPKWLLHDDFLCCNKLLVGSFVVRLTYIAETLTGSTQITEENKLFPEILNSLNSCKSLLSLFLLTFTGPNSHSRFTVTCWSYTMTDWLIYLLQLVKMYPLTTKFNCTRCAVETVSLLDRTVAINLLFYKVIFITLTCSSLPNWTLKKTKR